MLAEFDIVVIRPDYEDAEVRGKRGHVIGQVTADQVGVFLYDSERVWCFSPRDVLATGDVDVAARDTPKGAALRVSSKGEVLG